MSEIALTVDPAARSRGHLSAGRGLRRLETDALRWVSTDGRAEFHATSEEPGGFLPAGWYLVKSDLASAGAHELRPFLRMRVAGAVGSEGEWLSRALPAAREAAGGATLLRVEYPVTSLSLRPTDVQGAFLFSRISFRRVSRANALKYLMSDSAGSVGLPALRRVVPFLSCWLRKGMAAAVEEAYGSYRQHVLPPPEAGYEAWVSRFDVLGSDEMQDLGARADRLSASGPLISVILPVYETPERWLRACIESVRSQVYGKWELCISDDASKDPRVAQVIGEYVALDERIKFKRRDQNGHISESSNTALSLASGDYVAFLDHDDALRPHSLLEMAEEIVASPDLDLLYSDEDKIDGDDKRFDPYFKPDWNPHLLLTQNYLCHLTVIRRSLVERAGGFRRTFEGAQDHDLFLRCVELSDERRIRHVPKILYHWRAIEGSTALARDEKDYASDAGQRAVQSHLDRVAPGSGVEVLPRGHYRVRWRLPSVLPKVSIIIPTRDRVDLLRQCVSSVRERTRYSNYEILIIDNRSVHADTLDYLSQIEDGTTIRVLKHDAPFNFARMNNIGVAEAKGSIICLLNNDIEVISAEWLDEMVGHAAQSTVGAVGAMLYYPNDSIQHGGVILGIGGVANHAFYGESRGYGGHGGRALVAQNMSAVTAACMLVRRDAYLSVGGMDEDLAVAFNDIDFCLRLLRAGYRNVWTPHAELYHHESASRGKEDNPEKLARFESEVRLMQERWGDVLEDDPAYNPNLTLAYADRSFDLAFPPRVRPSALGR